MKMKNKMIALIVLIIVGVIGTVLLDLGIEVTGALLSCIGIFGTILLGVNILSDLD